VINERPDMTALNIKSSLEKHSAPKFQLRYVVGMLMAGLIVLAAIGCESPTTLPVTPNVLRDGSGSQLLAKLSPEQQTPDMSVVYVTDRAPFVGPTSQPSYGIKRSPSLAFGLATVSLDPSPTWEELVSAAGSSSDPKRYRLEVTKTQEVGKLLIAAESIEMHEGSLRYRPEVREKLEREIQHFIDLVCSRLATTSRKDVFIYVHGVDNTFEDAVSRAAVMWHYIGRQGVFLAYAWPAGQSGVTGYFYDRESGEYTVMHLKRLIQELARCPDVARIHIIAHSRGCDVSTTALRELNIEYHGRGENTQEQLKLETLILAAADLDAEVFGLRMVFENMAVIAKRFVVYSSSKDEAVGLADRLFQSQTRIGTLSKTSIPVPAQNLLAQVPNVQLVQCTVSGFGTTHDYVFTNPAAFSDLILVLRDGRNPGVANGRPLTSLGGAFWKLDNSYALPTTRSQP
jgi:esterase/lipase superfamily enzyme